MTLRARLLAAAVLLIVSLAVSGLLIIRTVENSELNQIDDQLRATVPIALGIGRNPQPPSSIPPRFIRTDSLTDRYLAVVVDGHRTTLASPQQAKGAEPNTPARVATSINSADPTTVGSIHRSGRWRAILLKTPNGNEELVAVYMGSVDATASQLRAAVLAAGGLMALILTAAGFWIERLGLRPITRMKTVAEAIIAGDRKRRVTPAASAGEAADLAVALNSMLDQQNEIEGRLRQFVADASHELRTPTAVISGVAQLWRQGELRQGQELEDAMRRIGQESTRMRALVEELLLLARLDEGMPLQNESVDLGDVVTEVLEAATSTHPTRSVRTEIVGDVTVHGEPGALRRVAGNLITNSLIHTPATSSVTVRLARNDYTAILEVSDGGPGMDPSEAAHAFDRFWRGETSRTRTGSGLGLSIARAIVEAHGGAIDLDTSADRGTTVTVTLPLEAQTHLLTTG